MARVTLILPISPRVSVPAETVASLRQALEDQGHAVDVVAVADPRSPALPLVSGAWWKSLVADRAGQATAAVQGIEKARGDVLVVVDPGRGYTAEDITTAIEPLIQGDADLAVASRALFNGSSQLPYSPLGALGRLGIRSIGTMDPFSGLIALTRSAARSARYRPIGSFFTLELVARTDGRRVDVPVSRVREPWKRLELDDLRHLKRLADSRFGNLSRLIQFCMVGASGMVVDLSCYALLQWVFSWTPLAQRSAPLLGGPLSLAAAGAVAIAVALTWNFSLNRRLTFSYARQGSRIHQFLAYVLSNALGIALSFSLRLLLPSHVGFFYRHKLAAAVVGIVAATGISFSMSRWVVFRTRPGPSGADSPESAHALPCKSRAPGAAVASCDAAKPVGVDV